jgi:hypothetical protein
MGYKLARLLIVMPLSRGLIGLAHLGREQIEPTRFAMDGEQAKQATQ